MKKITAIVLVLLLVLLAGCGAAPELSEEAAALQGEWAYIYTKDVTSLELKSDGKAVFENENYTYNCDAERITLTAKDGSEIKLRYVLDGETLYIYKQTTYTYTGLKEPTSVVGTWEDRHDNWAFEFTEEGTFREDGYFPGYYSVNEAEGTIKLVYNDQFEDTTIYYQLDGYELTVEYPWPMVPTVK